MKIRNLSIFVLVVLFICCTSFHTIDGNPVVPDEATAIKVAEAIWLPMFGRKIYDELPFHANLLGDTLWVVTSTFKEAGKQKKQLRDPNSVTVQIRGVLVAEIRKMDCKVKLVYHSK